MMNRFLLKLCFGIIPILILLSVIEFYARSNDQSANFYKKKFIIENAKEIEGVILGPSHILRGVHPKHLDGQVASLAQLGNSPNVDYLLYKYVVEKTKPKFVIIDLSLGYLSKHNSQAWIEEKKIPYYFKNITAKFTAKWLFVNPPFKKYFHSIPEYDEWGFDVIEPPDFFKKLSWNDSLILNHTSTRNILNNHNNYQKTEIPINHAFYKIVTECKILNIKIIFVSPPKYYIYNQNLKEELINDRNAFLKNVVDHKTVFFFDYESLYERNPEYFFNINHLNMKGAEMFSKELNKTLVTLKK